MDNFCSSDSLVGHFRHLTGCSRRQPSSAALFPSANLYGSFKDVNVAFPRTSGARFCGNGQSHGHTADTQTHGTAWRRRVGSDWRYSQLLSTRVVS